MESVIDLVTTTFKANLAVTIVFGAGYLLSTRQPGLGSSLPKLSRNFLLPALAFTTLASSSYLTWTRFLQIAWPVLVIALETHVAAIGYALFARRFFASPAWIGHSIVHNNVSSWPLLALSFVYALSTSDGTGLAHLRWRVLDDVKGVADRATVYILLNLAFTELARSFIAPIVERISPSPDQAEIADGESEGAIALPPDEEQVTESTPLITNPPKPAARQVSSRLKSISPVLLASAVGLLIAIIKPVQRRLLGITPDNTSGTWLWEIFGHAFLFLGATYAIVDILCSGAETKEVESNWEEGTIPPTLGPVLTISVWRYVLVPLITVSTIYGFRKINSTTFYLQDPAFPFVLVLTTLAPPTLVSHRHAFQSHVIFATVFTAIITCIPLAVAIGIVGRGVSYDTNFDLLRALRSAGGGGLAGAMAMVVQVLTLMPLRTIMNYQYRYGGSLKGAAKTMYAEGGMARYYAGLPAALFQGPFARFGDTAANAGIIALLDSLTWPVLIKSAVASLAAAAFRMVLTPVDTLKTTQQTKGGKAGLKLLRERIAEKGVGCLWYGALATAAATFVGHYPWFGTYNFLSDKIPVPDELVKKLFRQAFIGFAASVISDTVSNSLRVVKTYRQVHEGDVGYVKAAKEIVASEGLLGLFGRGLRTRLLTNGLQGLMFSVLWKLFQDKITSTPK